MNILQHFFPKGYPFKPASVFGGKVIDLTKGSLFTNQLFSEGSVTFSVPGAGATAAGTSSSTQAAGK